MNTMFYIIVMAGVTYLIRVVPLLFVRKEIKNQYVRSFLYYIPYAVLGAMSFPAIFTSGGAFIPSFVGTCIAGVLAFKGKDLLTVAIAACVAVYVSQLLLTVFI